VLSPATARGRADACDPNQARPVEVARSRQWGGGSARDPQGLAISSIVLTRRSSHMWACGLGIEWCRRRPEATWPLWLELGAALFTQSRSLHKQRDGDSDVCRTMPAGAFALPLKTVDRNRRCLPLACLVVVDEVEVASRSSRITTSAGAPTLSVPRLSNEGRCARHCRSGRDHCADWHAEHDELRMTFGISTTPGRDATLQSVENVSARNPASSRLRPSPSRSGR